MKRTHNPIFVILVGCLFMASLAGAQNSLDVNAGAAMGPPSSAFGLEVMLSDPASVAFNQAWVMADETKGFDDETTLKGSFFIGPQGVTMSSVSGQNFFQSIVLLQNFGPANSLVKVIFFLHRGAGSDDWFITAWHFNENAGFWVYSGSGWIGKYNNAFFSEILIEFEWTAGDPGTLVLYRTVWTNGAPDPSGRVLAMNASLAGMQTATINKVVAGVWSAHMSGTFGSMFLDEFVFTR